jgi:hypothetical protein
MNLREHRRRLRALSKRKVATNGNNYFSRKMERGNTLSDACIRPDKAVFHTERHAGADTSATIDPTKPKVPQAWIL